MNRFVESSVVGGLLATLTVQLIPGESHDGSHPTHPAHAPGNQVQFMTLANTLAGSTRSVTAPVTGGSRVRLPPGGAPCRCILDSP